MRKFYKNDIEVLGYKYERTNVIVLWFATAVASVLKDCNLNTNSNIFDNVGDLSFDTLKFCLTQQFKNFFPTENQIKVYDEW